MPDNDRVTLRFSQEVSVHKHMSDLLEEARGKPKCISVVLCNEVIEDKYTNNKTLVSLFNTILAPQLPSIHPRLFIMVSLTGGIGAWPISVSFRSPSGKEIFRLQTDLVFDNAELVQDIILEVHGLPLLERGQHYIDIVLEQTVVNSRMFSVQLTKGLERQC